MSVERLVKFFHFYIFGQNRTLLLQFSKFACEKTISYSELFFYNLFPIENGMKLQGLECITSFEKQIHSMYYET